MWPEPSPIDRWPHGRVRGPRAPDRPARARTADHADVDPTRGRARSAPGHRRLARLLALGEPCESIPRRSAPQLSNGTALSPSPRSSPTTATSPPSSRSTTPSASCMRPVGDLADQVAEIVGSIGSTSRRRHGLLTAAELAVSHHHVHNQKKRLRGTERWMQSRTSCSCTEPSPTAPGGGASTTT
jgi:hypothetical protein